MAKDEKIRLKRSRDDERAPSVADAELIAVLKRAWNAAVSQGCVPRTVVIAMMGDGGARMVDMHLDDPLSIEFVARMKAAYEGFVADIVRRGDASMVSHKMGDA